MDCLSRIFFIDDKPRANQYGLVGVRRGAADSLIGIAVLDDEPVVRDLQNESSIDVID